MTDLVDGVFYDQDIARQEGSVILIRIIMCLLYHVDEYLQTC